MTQKTISKLCCPFDKNDLELTKIIHEISGEVIEGFLICQQCNHIFPIIKGIPILIPDEYRDHNLEENFYQRWKSYFKNRMVKNFCITQNLTIESNPNEITKNILE